MLLLFTANQVDGEDFFALDMTDIYQMIPRFKLRKKFLTLWSEVTSQTQVRIMLNILYIKFVLWARGFSLLYRIVSNEEFKWQ